MPLARRLPAAERDGLGLPQRLVGTSTKSEESLRGLCALSNKGTVRKPSRSALTGME
jgi:hypothetical protein